MQYALDSDAFFWLFGEANPPVSHAQAVFVRSVKLLCVQPLTLCKALDRFQYA